MTAKLTEDNQYEDKDHPTLWLVSSNFQGFLSNFPDSSCPCEVWGGSWVKAGQSEPEK